MKVEFDHTKTQAIVKEFVERLTPLSMAEVASVIAELTAVYVTSFEPPVRERVRTSLDVCVRGLMEIRDAEATHE